MKIIAIQALVISCFTLLMGVAVAFGQKNTGSINGSVQTNDNKPLAYASIILKNTRYGIMADEDGEFEFDAPAGNYTLAITYGGYITTEAKVSIVKNEVTEVGIIVVNAGSIQLREVVVADIQ